MKIASVYALVTLVCVLSAARMTYGGCAWYESDAKLWSSPATWPSGKVPVANDDVVIPNNVKIKYDITTQIFFKSITIGNSSQLVIDGSQPYMTMDTNYINILAGAAIRAGSADCYYPNKFIITLYGPRDTNTSVVPFMGNKGIISAGTVALWGWIPNKTWTRIAATVNVGQNWILVQDDITGWAVGNQIVLATTDYYEWMNEVFTIKAISGRNITLNKPAIYLHWGANDEFAEVGLLTRNIVVQGDNSSDASLFGGHTIVFGNGTGKVRGVEFQRMGQANVLARYPMHYHFQGNQATSGSFINGCSFHNNYQRCFTIHGTSGIRADGNVGYNNTGHCYFFEEGSETNNTLTNNLGIYPTAGTMIPSDAKASVFWITNPNNIIINNTAVGGMNGFWYSLPWNPIGMSSKMTWMYPQNTPLNQFYGNSAHSNIQSGLNVDDCVQPDGTTVSPCNYIAMSVPGVSTSTPLRQTFGNFFSWKNRMYGMWIRGLYLTVDSAYLVDNGIGVNTATTANLVQNSLIVGETPNGGMTWMTRGWDDKGRSRPKLFSYDFPIHGLEVYDSGGNQFGRNVSMKNFFTDSVRMAGAIGYISHGYYILPPNNIISEVNILDGSNTFATEYNYDNYDGPKHVVLMDGDGSWLGDYGGVLVGTSPLLSYESNCTLKPEWGGFYNCKKSQNGYSHMTIYNTNTAATNYANSFSLTYRATITPLGHPEAAQPIKGIDVRNNYRQQYAGNVYSRKAYLYTFPHPTPPQLQVNLRYASSGEWIVAVFSYPSNTTFTITRGYYKNPLSAGLSTDDIGPMTYYFDQVNQFLYVMYYEDNGGLEGTAGFPEYQWGSQYVDITASCAQNCNVTTTQPLPPALVDREDKYRATLKGCVAGTTSTFEGIAYISYNNKTKTASYLIYHNVFRATSATLTGARSGLIINFAVAQSPIRGTFALSYTKWNELWAGDMSITIQNSNSNSAIKGTLGCAGVCSSPPMTTSWNPCTQTAPAEMPIYVDSLNSTYGWIDWSWNANRSFTGTGDVRCGSNMINVTMASWGALSLHLNGACKPGACTDLSWQKPYVNISNYKYFEFYCKSPAGRMPFSLTVQAQDYTDKVIGSVLLGLQHIDSYIIENSWTRVRVPLTDMGLKGNELMGTFGILANANLNPSWNLLFDNIKIVSDYVNPLTVAPYGSVKSWGSTC